MSMPKATHIALACTALLVVHADVRAQSEAAPSETNTEVLPIVEVTVSKRRQKAIDVPSALTTVTQQQIENLGIERFADYASLVPNLVQVYGNSAGSGVVVMRGMYTGPQQTTNTTATYFGETPISSSGTLAVGAFFTPDADLFEIQRIEVLKGPQGTLYGATALGGLMRIVPQQPDTRNFDARVRLGVSKVQDGGAGFGGKLSFNAPLSDGVAGLQVSAFGRRDGGFTKNVVTGEADLGRVDSKGASIALLLTPNKETQISLRLLSQDADTNGPLYQENMPGTGTPADGERGFSSVFTPRYKSHLDLAEATVQYESSLGTITGSAGRAKPHVTLQGDYLTYALALPALGAATAKGEQDVRLTKDTAEVRLATRRFGAFEGLAGLFYTKEDSSFRTTIAGLNNAGNPVAGPGANIITSTPAGTYKETALYGSGTYYFADNFDIGAGVRYAKNKQDYTITRSGLLGNPPLVALASEDSATTYHLVGRYRPAQDWSLFARYATGYRPGGPQTNPAAPNRTFDPDTVKSYEFGTKAYLMDRRLGLDVTVYHIDWSKVQLNALLGGLSVMGNAGRSEVDGAEAQLSWRDRALMLGASFGYNDARLTELGSTTAPLLGAAVGDSLPGSPKMTASLFGDYAFASTGPASWTMGATVRYRTSANAAYSVLPAANPNYVMPGFATLDVRAKVEWDRYSLRAGIDNVTDKNAVVAYSTTRISAAQPINSVATLSRPRTFTLTLGASF
ncbi:TonB-dependent receptor [Roseateles sp. NT4]|uniref:TonB-dependent receptor n=1 Tax=Roseateles sp. NT4 TaxID=3453715 RepID=UPI003EEC7D76